MTDTLAQSRTHDSGTDTAPAVSLILPVYNGERYLETALDSIFDQRFGDFELIAVDDCSTDGTARILANYAARHPNMRVITNATNSKLPASLNNGFRAARGRWLSWTSDDNLLRPDTLEQLVAATQAHPDADIYYADFIIIDEDGGLKSSVTVAPPENLIFGNIVGCCFLYRREVDEALNGYDEQLFGVEDYDFWLRAARHGFRFRQVHRELYSYRRHSGSLTDTRMRHIHQLTARILLKEIEALPPSPRRAEAYVRLTCRDAYTLRWKLLWLAFRDHPPALFTQWRDILGWLKFSIRVRLF